MEIIDKMRPMNGLDNPLIKGDKRGLIITLFRFFLRGSVVYQIYAKYSVLNS